MSFIIDELLEDYNDDFDLNQFGETGGTAYIGAGGQTNLHALRTSWNVKTKKVNVHEAKEEVKKEQRKINTLLEDAKKIDETPKDVGLELK